MRGGIQLARWTGQTTFRRTLFASWVQRAALAILCVCAPAQARESWLVLPNCRLQDDPSNDADSFHVQADRKTFIFRLYFVDAPETDAGFPGRVEEQGKYFGISAAQTVELGQLAKKFAQEKLFRPFTIRTCLQDALGRSKKERFYAFVETSEGDLAELLVANGLARVHGTAATPAGLSSPELEKQKLLRLEREARQQKIGGWGVTVGRMAARLSKTPAQSKLDSFDAFFHPERVAAAKEVDSRMETVRTPTLPTAAPQAPATRSPAIVTAKATVGGEKLDPNTATVAQLMGIKGIGPVLADRIIAARPFKNADDLRKVKGVGAKRFEKLRPAFAD